MAKSLYDILNQVGGTYVRRKNGDKNEILRIENILRSASEEDRDKTIITAYNLQTQAGTTIHFGDAEEYEEVSLDKVLRSEPIQKLILVLKYSLGDNWREHIQ